MATACGTRPVGVHSTIISLILAEIESARNRAVDQCGQAEALDQSQPHRWSGNNKLAAIPGGRSPLKADQGMAIRGCGKESTTGFDLPCSMMPSHETR